MHACGCSQLVECYWPDLTEAKLHTAAGRIAAATRIRTAAGTPLIYLGALLMPADETVFFLFDGCDEDVRTVATHARLPFERIAASRWIGIRRTPDDTGADRPELPQPSNGELG